MSGGGEGEEEEEERGRRGRRNEGIQTLIYREVAMTR